MNKLFLYLIIVGILTLVIVSVWEIYQISSGAKSTGEITVVELTNKTLIPDVLTNHFKKDPEFTKFIASDQQNSSQIP